MLSILTSSQRVKKNLLRGVIKNLDCLVGPYVSDIYQTTEIWTRRMSKAFADNKWTVAWIDLWQEGKNVGKRKETSATTTRGLSKNFESLFCVGGWGRGPLAIRYESFGRKNWIYTAICGQCGSKSDCTKSAAFLSWPWAVWSMRRYFRSKITSKLQYLVFCLLKL